MGKDIRVPLKETLLVVGEVGWGGIAAAWLFAVAKVQAEKRFTNKAAPARFAT